MCGLHTEEAKNWINAPLNPKPQLKFLGQRVPLNSYSWHERDQETKHEKNYFKFQRRQRSAVRADKQSLLFPLNGDWDVSV